MNRISIINTLQAYQETWASGLLSHEKYSLKQENQTVGVIQEFVANNENCFHRSNLAGHITGSALIVNPGLDRFLLMHHKKLDKWLQMGGHSDGHPEAQETAMREAQEESGYEDLQFLRYERLFNLPSEARVLPFDLDYHQIPERSQEPEHIHYDIRYLVVAPTNQPPVQSEEANELRWVSFAEALLLTNEESMLRQFRKVRAIAEKLLT